MRLSAKRLFLLCTESSGDLLGAGLVRELRKDLPDLQVRGVAGDKLAAEGMDAIYQVTDFNVMGLVEVVSQLKRLKVQFNRLVEAVRQDPPDMILLIDAPDFNLRFAKAVRALGVPIIYYVSPQVWAWRKRRAKSIAQLVDHMLVLFPFEVPIYEAYGLPTTWVGHPLVDALGDFGNRDDFCQQHNLDPAQRLVAIAPGSRNSVVSKLLPVMVDVAQARADRYQFALPVAPTLDQRAIKAIIGDAPIRLLPGAMRPLMAHADAAVVASGTATLETGLLGTPMVIGYKLAPLSYLLGRMLVKLPNIALVNIVLDERVVPELIQNDFCLDKILPELDAMIEPGPYRDVILEKFATLASRLGGGGADRRAANVVLEKLTA